jgi:porin
VPVSTHRVFHAWVQKDFADKQWSLLAGLYPIDSEFMVMDSAGVFVQPPYGALADLALTRGPSIFNNSAVGLRLKWTATDRSWYAQGAVLDGMPGHPAHPRGTHIAFQRGDGIMSIAEIGYRPGEAGHVFEPTTPDVGVPVDPVTKAHELAVDSFGKYAVGVWGYSAKADDLVDADAAGNPLRRKSRGWYALAEQTLLPGSAIGDISAFCRVSATDGNSTAIRRTQNIGIRLKGPLPGFADDVLGIAHTRAGLSDKFIQAQAAGGIAASGSESAWELTYRHQVNRWLAVQPTMQQFRHPGGDLTRPKATVAGIRLDIAL